MSGDDKKEEITKEDFSNFLNAFSSGIDKKDTERLADQIKKYDEEFPIDKSPEHCSMMYFGDGKRAFELYIEKFCIVEHKGGNLFEIYSNYKLIEPILTKVMEITEGSPCSADRSRWLINSYVEYLKTGKMFDMEISEKCYWKPNFGVTELWLRFIESTIRLRYGNYIDFLRVIGEIHEAARIYQLSIKPE